MESVSEFVLIEISMKKLGETNYKNTLMQCGSSQETKVNSCNNNIYRSGSSFFWFQVLLILNQINRASYRPNFDKSRLHDARLTSSKMDKIQATECRADALFYMREP